ncbi:MAG: hypothetical protein WBM16_06910, partial [Pseudolabrys sp.]
MSRIAVVTIFFIAVGAPGIAQRCNPAIDGTYCTSQPNPSRQAAQHRHSFESKSWWGLFLIRAG